ncbi:MAG: LCP family protein [Lachnospiraceae bacterium]
MSKPIKSPQGKTARRIRARRRRTRILLLLEILFILGALIFAFYYFLYSKMQVTPIDTSSVVMNDFDDPNIKDYQNIVFMGVDSQTNDLDEDTRADSIIVASINKKNKDVKLVSIYRDTYCNISDYGYTKINHSYAYGGPTLLMSTINRNYDLNIQDFVCINFRGLANMVNILGGIDIEIQEDEINNLNDYIRNMNHINGGHSVKIKHAGLQTLDGNQAVAYARIRYTDGGDYRRTERQRTVILSIMEKAKHSGPITLYKLCNEILPDIHTSLSSGEILWLAKDLFSYDFGETSGFPFDELNVGTTIGGVYYGIPETLKDNVKRLHEYLFRTTDYQPSAAVGEISDTIYNRYHYGY